MENRTEERNEALAPGALLAAFSGGRIAFWIAVAVLIHIVVIGMLSVGYIRDRWIDPEGAEARKAAAVAAQQQAAASSKPPATVPVAFSNAVTTAVAPVPPHAAAPSAPPAGTDIPPARTNSPVVKRITEKAEPADLPRQPGDLGISIEETNRR